MILRESTRTVIAKMTRKDLVKTKSGPVHVRKCLSCGTTNMAARRRYCSQDCRQQMLWVLSLSKGLLRVFNTRYAAFYFNRDHVVLDILPVYSKDISRFSTKRALGRKPALDLKELILHFGEEWYSLIKNNNSKSYASLSILKENYNRAVAPESVTPFHKIRPRFSKLERDSLKMLEMKIDEFLSEGQVSKIKAAYKKLAKIHHPDMGGDAEKFKKLNDAHQLMLNWTKNPQFTSRKALIDCWSYDGSTGRWAPPL